MIKRAFERIDKLREEGKLPPITPEDYENEPTALAFTPDDKFYFSDGEIITHKKIYTEDEVDGLVNKLIDKFLNYNGSYSDNEKLKDLYQQIKKKMNIVDMFVGPAHNLVWMNHFNEIMEDVYKSYEKKALDIIGENEKDKLLSKEQFINKIKTDDEFAEKWGVKITERELTLEERYNKWFNNNYETGMERYFDPNNLPDFDDDYYEPTPTKEITLEYKEEKVSYYE